MRRSAHVALLTCLLVASAGCPRTTRTDPVPVEKPRPKDADLTRRAAAGILGHFAVTVSVYPKRLIEARAKRGALFAWLEGVDADVGALLSALPRAAELLPGLDLARPIVFGLFATEQDAIFALATYGVPLSPPEEPRMLHLRASVPAADLDALVNGLEVGMDEVGLVPAPEGRAVPGATSSYVSGDTILGLTRMRDHVVLDLFLPDDLPKERLDGYIATRLQALATPGPLGRDAATLHFLEGHGDVAAHVDASRVVAYLGAPQEEGFTLRYAPRERIGAMFLERHLFTRLFGRWLGSYRGQAGDRTLSFSLGVDTPHARLTENLRARARDAYATSRKARVPLLPAQTPTLFSVHVHEALATLVKKPAPWLDGFSQDFLSGALDALDARDEMILAAFFLEHPWLVLRRVLEDTAPGTAALIPMSTSLLYEANTLEEAGSVAIRAAFPKGETREQVSRFGALFQSLLAEFGVVTTDTSLKTDIRVDGPTPEYRMTYAERTPLFAQKAVERAPGWYASLDASRVAVTVAKVDDALGGALLSLGRVRLSSRVFGGHRATIVGFGAKGADAEVLLPVAIPGATDTSPKLSAGEQCLRQEFEGIMGLVPEAPDQDSLDTFALAMKARTKGSLEAAIACAKKDPATAQAAQLVPSVWAYAMADLTIAIRRDAEVASWLEPACKARPLKICALLERFQKKAKP